MTATVAVARYSRGCLVAGGDGADDDISSFSVSVVVNLAVAATSTFAPSSILHGHRDLL